MQPSDWLPSAEVPALCGNQPGRLVAGELPDAFLVVDPDAVEPASVTLLEAPSPIVGDIDNDGRAEVIAATLCTYPSYYYPDGYQSLIAYDDRQAMVGEVTIDGYFGALSTDDAGVVVEWTTCEPEILACIPAGAHVGHLRRSAPGNLELVEDDAPTATTGIDASVALAPCVAVASMSIGMHGHRPEVALLQAELQRRGFDRVDRRVLRREHHDGRDQRVTSQRSRRRLRVRRGRRDRARHDVPPARHRLLTGRTPRGGVAEGAIRPRR
jgi:hypothetical protein